MRHVDVVNGVADAAVGHGDAQIVVVVMPGWLRRADAASYDAGTEETPDLLQVICAAIALYARARGPARTTATTYVEDTVVVCVLETICSAHEELLIVEGTSSEVIDGRLMLQTDGEDEFTAAVKRLTHRRVVAFMSANQTPRLASEPLFLDAASLTSAAG